VLRKVSALGPPWPEPEGASALGITTSHPDWMVDRLQRAFGEETARKVLDAANEPPAVVLRVRGDGIARDAVARELAATDARVERGHIASNALVVRGGRDPSAWASVRDGRATVQDESSQAVVDVLAPREGERALDVAAAPGGKSSAIAERVGPSGLVVAADLRLGRVGRIVETAERLALTGTLVPLVADGRAPPLRGELDAVLVDAPCTGLGVLRRRPDARWRVQPADVAPLAALQRELLAAAAPLVRRGGKLVYSVCTWTDEETLGVAAWAQTHLPDFTPEPLGPPWHPHDTGGLLLPSDGCDGMFVLNLRRSS
jgi:16S rRNA (cytosine967-C5)-methyltransferase